MKHNHYCDKHPELLRKYGKRGAHRAKTNKLVQKILIDPLYEANDEEITTNDDKPPRPGGNEGI